MQNIILLTHKCHKMILPQILTIHLRAQINVLQYMMMNCNLKWQQRKFQVEKYKQYIIL